MGISRMDIILLVILAIIILLVGGKKLPELAKGIGQSAREIKKGFKGEDTEESDKQDTKK